jgi:tRNA(Ile)-lysidine synthase
MKHDAGCCVPGVQKTTTKRDVFGVLIETAVSRYNMIQQGDSLTVALSGGADSVALLHFVVNYPGINVSACHVNHNLRGAESDSDETFVRDLCKQWHVPLDVHSVNVRALQRKHQSLEEAARAARYDFFATLPGKILTAHTASDNAETVLLNLIRGTGLKGLCGIPPVRENIVRPLILCERADVENYCREHALRFVTDSSNSCEEFTRNRIRLSFVPLVKEINPSFDCVITRMCDILRADNDLLERFAEGNDYSLKHLRSLEKPVITRIIMRILGENNVSPSNSRVSQIIGIVEAGAGKINLEKHKFAIIEDESLKIKIIQQNYR